MPLTLTPGTQILRRSAGMIQIGLDPDQSVAVVESATSSALVDELLDPAGAAPSESPLLRKLRAAGLVTRQADVLRGSLPSEQSGLPWVRHTLAALARRTPDAFEQAHASRSSCLIDVVAFGHPLGGAMSAQFAGICHNLGLGLRADQVAARGRSRKPTTVGVLIGVGEPHREAVDDWQRNGLPYLLVRLTEGRAIVGPFVIPGSTPCLRCLDAQLTERDPAWPLLVEQYARASRLERRDGLPEPVDAALSMLAIAWAARDVASFAEGSTPSTLGRTHTLTAGLDAVESKAWSPHPHCGCAWA